MQAFEMGISRLFFKDKRLSSSRLGGFALLFLVFLSLSGLMKFSVLAERRPGALNHLAGHIEIRNNTHFDQLLELDAVLIMYKAYWCSHCSKSFPDFQRAADDFRNEADVLNNVAMASIECTVDPILKDVCSSQNINGYPTFIFYKSGQRIEPPHLRREYKWYMNFMRRVGGEYLLPTVHKTYAEVQKSLDAVRPHIYFYLKNLENRVDRISYIIAGHMVETCDVFVTDNPSLIGKVFIESEEAVAVLHKDANPIYYNSEWELNSIKQFLLMEMFPLVGEITPITFLTYVSDKSHNLLMFFVSEEAHRTKYLPELTKLSKDYREFLHITTINASIHWAYGLHNGLRGTWPAILVHNFTSEQRYILETSSVEKNGAIAEFLKKITAGFHEQYLHSEPVPSLHETIDGELKKVVTLSFAQAVILPPKDIIVVFYNEHHHGTKELLELIGTVAKEVAKISANFEFTKYNAELNELPPEANIKILFLPVVVLFPQDKKHQPIVMAKKLNVPNLIDFLRGNSTNAQNLAKFNVISQDHADFNEVEGKQIGEHENEKKNKVEL